MSHITKSILAFNSEQLTNNEYVKDTVKVFDGVVRLTESSEKWVKIPLSTQFAYNGTNNLLITVCENTPSNVSKELQFATSNISATLTTHIANQNTAYDPVNSIYSMTMDDKKRNVIKLNMLV